MIPSLAKKSLLAAAWLGALAALAPAHAQQTATPPMRVIDVIEKSSRPANKGVDLSKTTNKACTLQSISCGQTINGSLASSDCVLTDGSYADYYEFAGTNGQSITATMRSTSVDSYLALLDPNDQDVQENDNGGGGNDARLTYQLTSTGNWAIAAGSFSSGETGPYTLTLTCASNPGGAPAAPSSLQATAVSSTEIDLTWHDNSNNETGFGIEALVSGSFQQIGTVSANATQAAIVNLTPQTSYTFRVRALNGGTSSSPSNQATATTPAGNDGYLSTSAIPNFRFKVRIFNTATPISGRKESDCIPETLCVSGAVAGRSEVFLRVIGPRPNGYLWPTIVRFTPSRVEVDVQQISTGTTKTYVLEAVPADSDSLSGLQDRTGFLP
jgi:hypothetical protein